MSIRPALLPRGSSPALAMLLRPREAMGWAHWATILKVPSEITLSKAAISCGVAEVLGPEAQPRPIKRESSSPKVAIVFIMQGLKYPTKYEIPRSIPRKCAEPIV